MIKSTQNFVYSRAFMDAILKTFTTIPAQKLITTPTVHLLMGALPQMSPDVTLAALAALEANFTGYAAATGALIDPVRMSINGDAALLNVEFQQTGPAQGATVTGYYVTDGTVLVGWEAFPANGAVPFAYTNDYLALNVILPGQCFQASS